MIFKGVRINISGRVALVLLLPIVLGAPSGCTPAPERQPRAAVPSAPRADSEADTEAHAHGASRRDNVPEENRLKQASVQAAPRDWSHEDLDATAWMQTSAEYRAIAEQTYRLAAAQLPAAVSDESWSAWPPQAADLSRQSESDGNGDHDSLRLAVIVDVDETVLDNSGFQADLIRAEGEYDPEIWNAWVAKEKARAVPGAVRFLQACRDRQIAVFFVTNREHAVESSTKKNLDALGLRNPKNPQDNILSKHEQPDWGSDKTPRRESIASTHRILLMVGDDLNDFVATGFKPTAEQRRLTSAEHAERWGKTWFLLPNPNYGGWERSLYEFDDRAPRDRKLQRKHDHLWTE